MSFSYKGLSFDGVKRALLDMFFGGDESKAGYVIPATHNYDNPLEIGKKDTYIEYWVMKDDRLGGDVMDNYDNKCLKCATVEFRFVGAQSERWVKLFHHVLGNSSYWGAFAKWCNAESLDYISPITPFNVMYAAGANSVVGFQVVCKFRYEEILSFSDTDKGERARFVSLDQIEISKEA